MRHNIAIGNAEDFEASVKDFFHSPDQLVFGQETAIQARNRFSDAVSSVLAKHQIKDVVLVAHGTIMTLFISAKVKTDPFIFWKALYMPSLIAFKLPEYRLDKVELDFT
jgi:broad specificity phosphatase PhoE